MKRCIALTALLVALTAGSALASEAPAPPENAQSLYLQAGKAERQGHTAKAQELYEAIIDRYPTSELAVKANDRLLELMRPVAAPAPAPAKPAPPVLDAKGKARELLELKKKADDIQDKEWRRLSQGYFSRYDHRYNRADLREKEAEWDKMCEEKVKKELGMGTAEIQQKLDAACRNLGITGPCNEKALQ
ncbi:hypothetical protein [Geomonas sp.]|uniref:hypothetical protein n=1 Tax=Geomonas sp. TaxID=2651584 RepID=UPI002B49EE31|nr:hypothetical protein [Geomonas sp.]HJV36881.1 hypothetical protein [Geomonas sp.]